MSKKNSTNGTSVFSLLGIAFVVLKLTNYIDWSWWYVTLPFWGGSILFIFSLGIYYLYLKFKYENKSNNKNKEFYKKPTRKNNFQKKLLRAMNEAENKKNNL